MKLKNFEIKPLTEFLYNLKLKGKESRMRTRFIKTLAVYWEETYAPERQELINSYAQKDHNGENILSEDKTTVMLIEGMIPQFNAEYEILQNECYVIDETESNEDVLLTVANALLNCESEISGEEATLYDDWCEKFEEVIERYNKAV